MHKHSTMMAWCIGLLLTTLLQAKPLPFEQSTTETDPILKQSLVGYGNITAWPMSLQSVNAKSWLVRCEDAAHAQLLQAKYLADTQNKSIGGKLINQNQVAAFQTTNGNCLGAARFEQWVVLFVAPDAQTLEQLPKAIAAQVPCDPRQLSWQSDTAVPMFLNRFDQHGFRFYYRPWEVPDKKAGDQYDPIKEFDYAREHGDLGFVFWGGMNSITTGEGLFNRSWWSWGLDAATQRNLPVQINAGMSYHAPVWLANQNAQWISHKVPQFVGGVHRIASPYLGGQGVVTMGDNPLRRESLALIGSELKELAKLDNVVSWLEPYGEVHHGEQDMFMDYGPQTNKAYAQWLKERYSNLKAVNERWYGIANKITDWNQIVFPEPASFFGYDDKAFNLTGEWKIAFTPDKKDAPSSWFKQDFDDSQWGSMIAPGHDQMMFLPKEPAVYRRSFAVDETFKKLGKRTWLYLWDMTDVQRLTITIDLNDKRISSTDSEHSFPHWVAVDVTDHLRDGENFLAIGLPRGFMAYRLYLSHEAPGMYPALDVHRNAQWADFIDFVTDQRADIVKMGLQMIRQIDDKRTITMMAPDFIADTLKQYASDYNGNFHNTGYMSAFWADYLPMLMRGMDRPFTLEPGGPANTPENLEKMVGCWLTEGVNGVDYFIHIGSVIWDDAIREKFEHYLPAIKTIGTYHQPKAQIAQLISSRVTRLTGFPWPRNSDLNLPSGYWRWNLSKDLSQDYYVDAVCEKDFANGVASDYRMIIDTNTSIMSEQDIAGIEQWVRDGGVFVTFAQTGRHLPEQADAWPISKITGYEVISCDSLSDIKSGKINRRVKLADGGKDFEVASSLQSAKGYGLKLKATQKDCEDLLLWDDGSVALGRRRLGKGYVVHVGCNFSTDRLWFGNRAATISVIESVIKAFDMPRLPGEAQGVRLRHYVSNNGLYDVWALWNENNSKAMTKLDIFGHNPGKIYDVVAGQNIDLLPKKHGARLANLMMEPNEVKLYITARQQQTDSPELWLNHQAKWWKQPTGKLGEAFPMPSYPNTVALSKGWQPIEPKQVEPTRLGVMPNTSKGKVMSFTQTFTVPHDWQNGRTMFWMQGWNGDTFVGEGQILLDDQVIMDWSRRGVDGLDLTDRLSPDSSHTLVVHLRSDRPIIGLRGESWLSHVPTPVASVDLAGDWSFSSDVLRFDRTAKLPGHWNGHMAKRMVTLPAENKNLQAMLRIDTPGMVLGVIVNGHWVRSHHHGIGEQFDINISPWLSYDQPNELVLVNWTGNGQTQINGVQIYYQK